MKARATILIGHSWLQSKEVIRTTWWWNAENLSPKLETRERQSLFKIVLEVPTKEVKINTITIEKEKVNSHSYM